MCDSYTAAPPAITRVPVNPVVSDPISVASVSVPAVSVPVSARIIPVLSGMPEISPSFPVTPVSDSEANPSMSPTSAFMASLGAD